jgi:hypothetical protein
VGNRVGNIGAVKTSGLTRLPNDGGGCRRTLGSSSLRKIRGALLSRGVFQKSEITSRKVSPENRPGCIFFGLRDPGVRHDQARLRQRRGELGPDEGSRLPRPAGTR